MLHNTSNIMGHTNHKIIALILCNIIAIIALSICIYVICSNGIYEEQITNSEQPFELPYKFELLLSGYSWDDEFTENRYTLQNNQYERIVSVSGKAEETYFGSYTTLFDDEHIYILFPNVYSYYTLHSDGTFDYVENSGIWRETNG